MGKLLSGRRALDVLLLDQDLHTVLAKIAGLWRDPDERRTRTV